MADQETGKRGSRGRPVADIDEDGPGLAYVTALRVWADELSGMTRTELANKLKISVPTLTQKLQNHRKWQASNNLLTSALKIIDACGGSKADIANWTTYHNELREYLRCGATGEPPVPPTPQLEPSGDARSDDAPAKIAEPPSPPPQAEPKRTKRRRIIVTVVGAVVVLVGGVMGWTVFNADEPLVRIRVSTDSDELVTTPALRDTMGNYATELPITKVPPPPDGRDRCANRYEWAHSEPINALDAGASVAKIDITAVGSDVKVDRARLRQDSVSDEKTSMALLACPGRGGGQQPHLMTADLDSGVLMFFPNGGDQPANFDLRIAEGHTESIFLIATALKTYSKWRLELGGDDGERSFAYTIGQQGAAEGQAKSNPRQQPFETIGEFLADPFRFRDGTWQPGR